MTTADSHGGLLRVALVLGVIAALTQVRFGSFASLQSVLCCCDGDDVLSSFVGIQIWTTLKLQIFSFSTYRLVQILRSAYAW